MKNIIMVMLATVLSVTAVEAQWIQVENYREFGEDFNRNDLAVTGMYGPLIIDVMWRNRAGFNDTRIGFTTDVVRLDDGIALSVGLNGATSQTFFPVLELNWAITFPIGTHFVNTTGALYQTLENLDITLTNLTIYQNTLDYYIGDWRISNRIMIGDAVGIGGASLSVSRYYEKFNWTAYFSATNELIDIPSVVAFVEEGGVVARWRFSKPLELSMAAVVGERGHKRYFLSMIGMRSYF